MAITFKDINDTVVEIIEDDTELSTDTDVVSGDVSRYVIKVNDTSYEVNQKTYEAVEKHLG